MKKMKRLLVAMLSCLTAFACVAGMSACKKDEKTGDSSVQAPASSVESVVEEVSSEEVSSEEVSSEEPAVCEHEWAADEDNTVAATCTDAGVAAEVCVLCGETKSEEVAALGHNWVVDEENSVAAGCIVDGLTIENCDVCGAHQETVAPQFGHSFDLTVEGEQVKAPTCTEVGEIRWYCAHYEDCGGYQGEDIPMAAHTWVETAEVPATCTEAGVTAYNQCSVCEAYANKPEAIPALGHDLVEAELKAPTCTETGLTSYSKCTRCDYEEGGEEIPAAGHIGGEADCLAPAICEVCGEAYGKALGHNVVLVEMVLPTCTTWGTSAPEHKCTRCDYTYYDANVKPVRPIAHDFDTSDATCMEGARCEICKLVVTTPSTHHYNVIEAQKETCVNVGWDEYRVCKDCGDIQDYVEYDAIGHDWDVEVYGSLPTCTTKGSVYRGTCLNCGEVLNKNIEIPTLPHVAVNEANCTEAAKCACGYVVTPALGHTTVKVNAQAATCEAIGWKDYTFCIVCNETFNYVELAALGHKPVNKVAAKEAKCTTDGNDEYYTCANGAKCEYAGNVLVATDKYTNYNNEILATIVVGEASYYVVASAKIEKLGHDLDETAANYVEGKLPTCTEPGYTASGTCEVCKATVKAETIYANGHTSKQANNNYHDTKFLNENSRPATCTAPAYCGECGEEYGTVHAAKKWVGVVEAKSATCTTEGNYKYNTCADCGQVWINKTGTADCVAEWITEYVDTGKVDANGDPIMKEVKSRDYTTAYDIEDTIIPVVEHRYVLEMPGKDATCTEDGYEAFVVCQLCGKLESDIIVIPAFGHTSSLEGTCREWVECETCTAIYANPNVTEDHHFDVEGHEGECVICGICENHKYVLVETIIYGDDKYDDHHAHHSSSTCVTPIYVYGCEVCGHQIVDHK